MSVEQQNYWTLLENSALTSLKKLREEFPNVYFFFFEPDYYLFFKNIADKNIPDINVVDIMSTVPIRTRPRNLSAKQCCDPNDDILYIGRPFQLLQICRTPVVRARTNPVIFASVPLYSHSLRIDIWKTPVNFKSFASFSFPFVPFSHYLQLAVGTFKTLFIREPMFELKAMKDILLSLSTIFGRFERVYSAGSFSTKFAKPLFETQTNEKCPIKNNLILIDRTVDLLNMIRVNDSYISFLEEVGAWDRATDQVEPHKLATILNVSTQQVEKIGLYTKDDPLFEKIALLNLPEATRQINTTEMQKNIPEQFIQNHTKVINWLNNSLVNGYLIDLVLRIQRNMVDALEYGRCVPLSPYQGPSLAFRMLSILHYNGKTEATQSIARLLAAKFGISMFSKWNEADELSMKAPFIDAPSKLKSVIGPFVSPIVALLGQILTDSWKRPNLPVNDSYVSTEERLSNEKYRWFIGVLGGMSATELRMFKKTAAACRPDDEFIFMTTDIISCRQFMNDIIH